MNELPRADFRIGDVPNYNFVETSNLFKELLDRNILIFRATTLTRVSLDEESLESLQKELVSRLPGFTATMSLIDNKDYMLPSLKVVIGVKGWKSYECLFVSVKQENHASGTNLPILCVLSGFSMTEKVHKAIEITFGCVISTLSVQKYNAHWLIAISINEFFRRDLITEFSVVYKVQSNMKISCNLPFGELYHFWRGCIISHSNKLKWNEVKAFIDKFTSFFEETYKIKMSWFPIIGFLLNETTLSFENEIEIKSNMAPLLYFLLSYIESDLVPTC